MYDIKGSIILCPKVSAFRCTLQPMLHMYMYIHIICTYMFTHTHIHVHSRMLQAVVASLPCSVLLLHPWSLQDTDPQVVREREREKTMHVNLVHNNCHTLLFCCSFVSVESPLQSPGTSMHQPPYFSEVSDMGNYCYMPIAACTCKIYNGLGLQYEIYISSLSNWRMMCVP